MGSQLVECKVSGSRSFVQDNRESCFGDSGAGEFVVGFEENGDPLN